MWVIDNENHIMYFISTNFRYQSNVAILSFNNTLIKDEISKEKLPYMQLYNNKVLPFLQQVNIHGSIIIIENMYKTSQENIKLSIGRFFKLLNNEANMIPFMILFPLKNNKFKMPYTHIFKRVITLYKMHDPSLDIDLEASIVIGNNAGRSATTIYKCDSSDVDRAFASNVGISNFRTPNQTFENDLTPRQWRWKNNKLAKILERQKVLTEVPINTIIQSYNNLIIFIAGPPTSGKTVLGERIKYYLDNMKKLSVIYDINKFESSRSLQTILHSDLINEISLNNTSLNNTSLNIVRIIVDSLETHPKRESYFKLLETLEFKSIEFDVKYIEIDIDRPSCEFLNLYSLQIAKIPTIELTPVHSYNTYYNYYRIPNFNKLLDSFNKLSKKIDIKYIKYPIIFYIRKEIHYHF